jgi:hypothetical protein
LAKGPFAVRRKLAKHQGRRIRYSIKEVTARELLAKRSFRRKICC